MKTDAVRAAWCDGQSQLFVEVWAVDWAAALAAQPTLPSPFRRKLATDCSRAETFLAHGVPWADSLGFQDSWLVGRPKGRPDDGFFLAISRAWASRAGLLQESAPGRQRQQPSDLRIIRVLALFGWTAGRHSGGPGK